MLPHPLTNFEIQKYFQNEPKFYRIYSRNNLSKHIDRAYIIKLDKYESIGTHWIALYVNAENVTYSDSFGVEHSFWIRKEIDSLEFIEIRKFIENKNIPTKIYKIQAYDSVMLGYFCICFIDFMLKGKSLLEYTNIFFPNEYKKNDKIILKNFK